MSKSQSMLTSDQLQSGTPADRVIELKAVFKTKHLVNPAFDRKLNWYAGIPRLSEEDKRSMKFFTTPESKLVLEDGMQFDLNDDIDTANWEWVKHLPIVASSFEDAQQSKVAQYYVHIEGKEARKKNESTELVFEAMKHVLEDSPVNYENRSLLLGFDMEGEDPELVKEFLLEQARDKKTAKNIIRVYTSSAVSIQLLYLKAKKENIIVSGDGGVIKFGPQVLGMNDDSAVAFLQMKENKELVSLIERDTNPEYFAKKQSVAKTKLAPADSIEEEEED
jgi:hypothetical protein